MWIWPHRDGNGHQILMAKLRRVEPKRLAMEICLARHRRRFPMGPGTHARSDTGCLESGGTTIGQFPRRRIRRVHLNQPTNRRSTFGTVTSNASGISADTRSDGSMSWATHVPPIRSSRSAFASMAANRVFCRSRRTRRESPATEILTSRLPAVSYSPGRTRLSSRLPRMRER